MAQGESYRDNTRWVIQLFRYARTGHVRSWLLQKKKKE